MPGTTALDLVDAIRASAHRLSGSCRRRARRRAVEPLEGTGQWDREPPETSPVGV